MRFRFVVGCFIALQLSSPAFAAVNPCEGAQGWRQQVCEFAKKNLVHFAWGYEHGIRDYQLAMQISEAEKIKVDEEVLFAAGMLHDMGGFAPYEQQGVDHALRSTQVVAEVLGPAGFPMEKIEEVKKAILTHSYYEKAKPQTPEAVLLHDADTLDFMGTIGIARLLTVSGGDFPDPKSAVSLLTKFSKDLRGKILGGEFSQKLADARAAEMAVFLGNLEVQTFGLGLPNF